MCFMKRAKMVFSLLIFISFLSWFCPYAKNEILTLRYGKEFTGLQKQTNLIDEVDYLKVLNYSDNFARVYYVEVEGMGNVLSSL